MIEQISEVLPSNRVGLLPMHTVFLIKKNIFTVMTEMALHTILLVKKISDFNIFFLSKMPFHTFFFKIMILTVWSKLPLHTVFLVKKIVILRVFWGKNND